MGKIHFGVVIIVCAKAEESGPTIPGIDAILYWPFEDRAAFEGSEENKLNKFREVRDKIHERLISWMIERKILKQSQ